jgi:hypothetical protein
MEIPKNDPLSNDPRYNFYATPTIEEIIEQQGKKPITDLSVLRGDFWPDDEPIEDFLSALHDWRGHNRQKDKAA